MPWHCPVPSLGGAFAEHQLGCGMGPGLVAGPGSRDPQGPPGAQACHELSLESAAALDIEGLVDRFVADAHGLVIGELDPEPVRDLLRAPSSHPPAVRAIWLVAPFPLSRRRPSGRRSVRAPHLAREPFGHIVPQTVVLDELGRLGTTSDQLGLPLRDRRPILQLSAAGGRISAQLPGDRRRAPTQPAGDRSHTETLSAKHRDLLSLAERQIPARQRGKLNSGHPATLPEPAAPHRLGHPHSHSRLLARHPLGDLTPKPPLDLPPQRRLARRPHRRPTRQLLHPPRRPAHRAPPSSRCCDDRLNPPSSRRGRSPSERSTQGSCRRWDRSATASTTR